MQQLRGWARELGFSQIGIAEVDLATAEPGLLAWLHAGFHGGMGYMAAHGLKRARPVKAGAALTTLTTPTTGSPASRPRCKTRNAR